MPYNFFCRFKNSLTDPIDHIFFDFFSTPPIIAPEPLIYDVAEGSSLRHMLTMLEQLFGGATVVQAAEAVGYENASSLSRALASISNTR